MRHCYDCGVEIRDGGHRRVVETGRSRRVYYGTRRTSVARSTSEGRRTLCASCAKSRDTRAAIKFLFICGAAALLGAGYINRPMNSGESPSMVVQQDASPPPRVQDSNGPSETASINPPAAPAPETIPQTARPSPPFPLMGGSPSLLDPNLPADAERVQDRLRSLGFSVNDAQGVWSKGTDLAVRRFRKSRGLRSDWRWDLSTQTALFAQAK